MPCRSVMMRVSLGEIALEKDSYRAFRSTMLEQYEARASFQGWRVYADDYTPLHPIQQLRVKIGAFRGQVACDASRLLRDSPQLEPHVRRALGIPATVPLLPDGWAVARQIGLRLLPERLCFRRARGFLNPVRFREGREFLFKQFVQKSLPGLQYYDGSYDYFLSRSLVLPRTVQELERIQWLDDGTIWSADRLGLRTPGEFARAFQPSLLRLDGRLLRVLVEEGAVQSQAELAWVKNGSRYHSESILSPVDIKRARCQVRVLLTYGVSRQQVAEVFRWSFQRFAPERLEATLALLRAFAVDDLSRVFSEVGDSLWLVSTERWRFLLEEVRARTAQDIGRFKPLLEAYHCVSVDMVRCLYRLGADLEGMAGCQSMLREVARQENSPVEDLERLAAPAHALSISQLAQCISYLDGRRDLAGFLAVLFRHGYGGAESVLAFQVCYEHVGPKSLDHYLSVVGERGRGEPDEAVAEWVLLAAKGGYWDSFEYLVATVDLPSLASLHQVLKVAKVGAELLRHLVEERGLTTRRTLCDWYQKAEGIQEYQGGGFHDALDRVLLDDAFARNRFNLLEHNQACVASVVGDRVTERLGPWPSSRGDEATRQAYWAARDVETRRERDYLVPHLPPLLDRSGGLLLPSLLETLWAGPQELDRQLTRFSPLLDELLKGRGPTSDTLSKLEIDAIGWVYCTAASVVRQRWPELLGREGDIAKLSLRSEYPMAWTRTQWRIKRPLDREGLHALAKAASFAKRFAPAEFTDMFDACRHLRPGLLTEPSADVLLLLRHLGVLLAAAALDTVVAEWLREGFAALREIDDDSLVAYQRIRDLHDFFCVALPDALAAHQEQFVARFNEGDAMHLASRLGVAVPEQAQGHACLAEALARTRDVVLRKFSAWAKRELSKFVDDDKATGQVSRFSATVSKHPAAFFAKEAALLCTRPNIKMWLEERHSHLLVFDPVGKKLVGMAMLYIEPIPVLHRSRPSLIIRAINPTEQAMACHDPASIVDAFLGVAEQIAHDNQLAAVAFPTGAGMHLLSNRQEIEDDLKARFISRASPWLRYRGDEVPAAGSSRLEPPHAVGATFDAYEKGQARVEILYVIWRAGISSQEEEAVNQYSDEDFGWQAS